METERDRFIAMQERRRDTLEPLVAELNPKAYEVQVIEMKVELADIYSAMFDVYFEEAQSRGGKYKKGDAEKMNGYAMKSIQNGKEAREIILKKEEKYDYAQAFLNLTLSIARLYSKLYQKNESVFVKNLECSFREYEWIEKFLRDFMVERKITSLEDLPKGMTEPYKMMKEMVELLPIKIAKLNAKIAASK